MYDVIEYGGRPTSERYQTNYREWTAGVNSWKKIRELILSEKAPAMTIHNSQPDVMTYFLFVNFFLLMSFSSFSSLSFLHSQRWPIWMCKRLYDLALPLSSLCLSFYLHSIQDELAMARELQRNTLRMMEELQVTLLSTIETNLLWDRFQLSCSTAWLQSSTPTRGSHTNAALSPSACRLASKPSGSDRLLSGSMDR